MLLFVRYLHLFFLQWRKTAATEIQKEKAIKEEAEDLKSMCDSSLAHAAMSTVPHKRRLSDGDSEGFYFLFFFFSPCVFLLTALQILLRLKLAVTGA